MSHIRLSIMLGICVVISALSWQAMAHAAEANPPNEGVNNGWHHTTDFRGDPLPIRDDEWLGINPQQDHQINSEENNNDRFDFKKYLFEAVSTLFLTVETVNRHTGEVTISGVDTQRPTIPFIWDWGDGIIDEGWFPQQHTYADLTRNYSVKVTAQYADGETDSAETTVHFVSSSVTPIPLPSDIAVSIPDFEVALTSRQPGYGIPNTLTYFDDSFFGLIPRSTIEYVLTVAAFIQKDFVNDDIYLIDGDFQQVMLRDASFGGMYSLWYTSPVSFGVGDYGLQGMIRWSSFLHEMGHNFTLNSPADYHYGGKIDGSANAIFSESMAQIFQIATAYEIINDGIIYGLSNDIIADIKQSAISSIRMVRNSYEDYLSSGMHFTSWNDPNTPEDETFNTFTTLAYKFFEYAEKTGLEYRIPLKRMLTLLQVFNEDLRQRYDQYHHSGEADAFRSTLMVTALSYAFTTDLRDEFRNLNFPINDETYDELIGSVDGPPIAICQDRVVSADPEDCSTAVSVDNGSFDPDNDPITLVQSPAGPYPPGETVVTLTVTDNKGAFATCQGTVTVVDEKPPVIDDIEATPNFLWPPNHKMRDVTVSVTATDNCDPEPLCKITSVMSNEPKAGTGDGKTAPDWHITAALTVELRAERSGRGTGRVYTVETTCTDKDLNATSETVGVTVPHDKRHYRKR